MNYTVDEGNSLTFECTATGFPAPEITWLRDGVELNSTSDPRIKFGIACDPMDVSRDDNKTVVEVTRNLNLTDIVDEDSGSYVCVATNIAGSRNDTFEVIVQGIYVWSCSNIANQRNRNTVNIYINSHTIKLHNR